MLTKIIKGFIIVPLVVLFTDAYTQTFTRFYPNPLAKGGYIAWADYDKDGDDDLITSGVLRNGSGATILYRNDGGDFKEVSQTFENFTGSIQWLDFENDGDLDLFLYDGYSTGVAKVFRNINGTFSASQFAANMKQMKWVDFDGDNDLDMVGLSSSSLNLRENLGSSFTSKSFPEIYGAISGFAVADFNGDTKSDFLVKFSSGTISIYLNKNGTYTLDTNNPAFAAPNGASLVAHDYETDGDTDIILAGQTSEGKPTAWLYTNTNGIFTRTPDSLLETGSNQVTYIDADSNLDILQWRADSTIFYVNKGSGIYVAEPYNSVYREYREVLGIGYSKHVDGEGQLICLSGRDYYGEFITRIFRKKDGVYKNIYPNPMDLYSEGTVQWLDYNQDGLKDVYISPYSSSSENPNAKLFKSTGTGLELVYEFARGPRGDGQWIDFNKDGKIDLVTEVDRTIRLYEGFIDGNVTSRQLIGGVMDRSVPSVVDFDKDNDNDIFVSDYMEGLYVNNNNVLNLSIPFDSYRDLGEADWADYDLDGDLDLAMFMDGSNKEGIRVYKNTGTTLQEVTNTGFPSWWGGQVKWIDYDQDKFPDLFMLGWNNNTFYIRLYRNDKGTFVAQSAAVFTNLANLDEYASRIKVVDFNVDGYPDLVVGGNTTSGSVSSKMFFYKNNRGTFEVLQNHGVPSLYYSNFDFGDFDGDGDPDLLLTGNGDHNTQLYINSAEKLVPPVIVDLTPKNHDTLVYANGTQLKIQFSEAIKKGTGSLFVYRKSDHVLIQTVDVSDPSVVANGNDVLISIAGNPFDDLVQYYMLCSPGAFVDFDGNANTGIQSEDVWNVVVDNQKLPQIISFAELDTVETTSPSFELTATATSSLPVRYTSSNPLVATIDGSMVTITGFGTTLITAFQDGNEEFNQATPVEVTLEVVRVQQQITFPQINEKNMGDLPFTLEAVSTSLLPVRYASSDSTVATIDGNVVTIRGAGTTVITSFQDGDKYFEPALPITVAVTVVKLSQQITFESIPVMRTGDAPFPLQAIATSLLEVNYTSSNPQVATIDGDIIMIVSAGVTEIEATQPGNSIFEPAEPVIQTFVVEFVTAAESDVSGRLKVFPNPTRGRLTLLTSSFERTKSLQISVYDCYGHAVSYTELPASDQIELMLGHLPDGMYILSIVQGQVNARIKFSKF